MVTKMGPNLLRLCPPKKGQSGRTLGLRGDRVRTRGQRAKEKSLGRNRACGHLGVGCATPRTEVTDICVHGALSQQLQTRPLTPQPRAAGPEATGQLGDVHVQGLLGLGGLLLGAVADHGVALSQVQVECDERPVLQTQRPQGGAVDLREEAKGVTSFLGFLPRHRQRKRRRAWALNTGQRAVVNGLVILTFRALLFTMLFLILAVSVIARRLSKSGERKDPALVLASLPTPSQDEPVVPGGLVAPIPENHGTNHS